MLPWTHSVLVMALDSGLTEGVSHLEPLEHSVLSAALVARPVEGTPVLEPLEHSVLAMTLDDERLEVTSDCEPLAHAVLSVALDGRPMEGIPDLEPLEHSVLGMALDSGLTEGISHLEPLVHSVWNVALDDGPVDEMSQLEPLERSVLSTAPDGRPMEGILITEPLEHSVLDVALDNGIAKGNGEPMLSSDRKLTFLEIPYVTGNVDLVLGAAVPLPADDVGRVALSPVEVRLNVGDMCITDNNTAGFQCWNMDRDILDQYEMLNGMPVYYGGDMYDSEDSEWDDPYALASAAYVEDYNFDVPEGMDLMVHRQSWIPDGSDAQRDDHTDMAPMYHTVSCVTRNRWDVFDDDSLTEEGRRKRN